MAHVKRLSSLLLDPVEPKLDGGVSSRRFCPPSSSCLKIGYMYCLCSNGCHYFVLYINTDAMADVLY